MVEFQGDLHVAGNFDYVDGEPTNSITRWDGTEWTPLGGGLVGTAGAAKPGTARDMVVFDDGSGPALYVAGDFGLAGGLPVAGLARWDGTSWSVVPGVVSSDLNALEVFDDGSGPELCVGGSVVISGGSPLGTNVACWDGVSWTELGVVDTGVVHGLLVFDDGNGAALLAAGSFGMLNATPETGTVARWNGNAWGPVMAGSYIGGVAYSLTVFDAGGGNELYAVGSLRVPPTSHHALARASGSGWVAAGPSLSPTYTEALAAVPYDDGSGEQLWVAGTFSTVGGQYSPRLMKWDGATFIAVPAFSGPPNPVYLSALLTYDLGSGPELLIGGTIDEIGIAPTATVDAGGVATWNGSLWGSIGNQLPGPGARVLSIEFFDDGSGPAVFAGGRFERIGGLDADYIARWDRSSWGPVGGGMSGFVRALTVHDDGTTSGPRLYAGGDFTTAGGKPASRVARWDGATWEGVGALDGSVQAFIEHDDGTGPALFAAGDFYGGVRRWDGTLFSSVGSGLNANVRDLAVYDDGAGPALYAVGNFTGTQSGGMSLGRVARWDGSTWADIGANLNLTAHTALVFDDGSGPELFIGGQFTFAGGTNAQRCVKWNGSSWTPAHLGAKVWDLESFDDGTGPRLLAAAGDNLHVRAGGGWAPFEGGTDAGVVSVGAMSGEVFIGGDFDRAGGQPSTQLARWTGPSGCPAVSYCTAGTSAGGCQARISATGEASATASTGFSLVISDVEGQKDGLFFYGVNGRQANSWGSGTSYVCVIPPRVRGGLLVGVGTTGACDGSFSQDLNARWCTSCAKPAHNPGAGALMQAQMWYRDPASTSNQTSSLSDAIEFTVGP